AEGWPGNFYFSGEYNPNQTSYNGAENPCIISGLELEKSSLPPAEPAYLVNPIQTPTAQELVYKELERALSVNREFHFAIYREAGMPLLFPMIQNLWDQVSPYYHLMFRQTLFADPRTGPRYHKKIIQSLAAKDPQKASKWLKTDLVESAEFVASVMRSIQAEKDDR
ncbi:MAG TPA: GntR family transcriptional regulator, partial [Desulfobacteraceae bacterium]|nr:GntR family transcriptional regulator [Desulfobacteraceae bacterium]